jgi:hypothetical protein
MKYIYSHIILSASAVICLLLFSTCEKELDLNIPVSESKLVVEGWIENGKGAEVILSRSAPYFSAIDSNSILDYAVTHAKVTLTSGDQHEILTLGPNKSYFPPFVYKSTDIKGEIGKTYSIEVILNGDTITASTSIPEPVSLDSVWFAPDPGKEGKGRIWARLTDRADQENFYRILYKRKGKDNRFVPGNFSTFSDILFSGRTVEMGFLRGYSSLLTVDEENYFEAGDTVSVKFSSIDREQFDFWNGYQSEVLAAANPLSASYSHLKSNIRGGLGIWTGYGATYYLVYPKK